MKLDIDFIEAKPKEEVERCKGLFFRCKVENYMEDNGSYVSRIKMVPLRKKSCPGCSNCYWLLEDLNERLDTVIIEGVEHGKLYELQATNFSRDWESGVVDDWDLEFVRVKEAE